jgi:FkbM family methyltransferase
MVYSFEPSEREFRRLLESVDLSAAANVTPVHLAAAATSGRGLLRVARSIHSGLNTLGDQFAYDTVDAARLEPVETIALDDFVDRHGIREVAAIKLDIEGAEAAALAGAMSLLREKRPALIVEIVSRALHANGSTRLDVEKLLRSAAYRLHRIDEVSAALHSVAGLDDVDGQNVVALPEERSATLMSRLEAGAQLPSRGHFQGPATRTVVGPARHG